jgi:hypothetical protein
MESIGTQDYYALHLLATWTKENPQNIQKDLIKQAIAIGKELHFQQKLAKRIETL